MLQPGGVLYLSTAPFLSLAGAHLPRLLVPVPLHLLLGRRLAFRAFCGLARHAPWTLRERKEANTFIALAALGKQKEDDLHQRVTLRLLTDWIRGAGFRVVREERHITGFFRALPGGLRRLLERTPFAQDVMTGPRAVRAGARVTGAPVLMPADVRFPLERANGVQLVKTAAALAASGRRTTLFVRRSDPRPTAEVLALYGVGADDRLTVERAEVGHRAGAFALPRLRFLARAGFAAWRALRNGAVVFTRDLQLADLVLRASSGPLVYEAHAVEALMYGERGALYGTSEQPDRAKAARIAAREARVWRRAAGFVTTTARNPGLLQRRARAARARARDPERHGRARGAHVPGTLARDPAARRVRGPALSVEGRRRAGARLCVGAGRAARDPGRPRGRGGRRADRALVAQCGLADRTEMPGTVAPARVADELARAAVVVAPFLHTAMSERHTSPLKAFEAMAAGRPLVASDLPASREFLRDGENALLDAARRRGGARGRAPAPAGRTGAGRADRARGLGRRAALRLERAGGGPGRAVRRGVGVTARADGGGSSLSSC